MFLCFRESQCFTVYVRNSSRSGLVSFQRSESLFNQTPFHALFTAVKLGYTANAATVKTQFYTLTSVSRDCAGTEHTQTRAESHSFALSRQVTLSLASLNNSFALEKMFSSQRINAASLFQSLWKTWAKWGQTC